MPDPLGPSGWAYWQARFMRGNGELKRLRQENGRLRERLSMAEGCSSLATVGVDAHGAVVELSKETMGKLIAAEKEIERLKAERLKLDRRIHNQRRALRENWEIYEMRGRWLGSEVARRGYIRLLKENRRLRGRDELTGAPLTETALKSQPNALNQ